MKGRRDFIKGSLLVAGAAVVGSAGKAGAATKFPPALVYTKDTPGVSNCYDQCAQKWPPLTVATGVTPTAGQGVSLTLGTIQRTDGATQVTINRMPAYYWYNDSKPGDASGQGVGGVWYVLDTAGNIKP